MATPRPTPERWYRRVARAIRRATEIATIMVAFGALLLWCSVPDVSELARRNPPTTAFIELRRTQAADAGQPFTLRWQWRELDDISPYLRAAVVYAEDYWFYRHEGVDWGAMRDAAQRNWDRGNLGWGGSTITQQVAKNLYLSPSRSIIRKARELLIAFRLEDELPKQRILEIYLNICEWGDGVFGAEAAARRWYGRSARSLTPVQAARLAVALPNPRQRSPETRSRELDRKAARIIRLMKAGKVLSAAAADRALAELRRDPDEPVQPTAPPVPVPVPVPVPDPEPAPDPEPEPATPPDPEPVSAP